MENQKRKKGFSLIELLIVVAIIVILAAMILPVLNKARERARRTVCMNNLRQWGFALIMYSTDYDGWFPGDYKIYYTPTITDRPYHRPDLIFRNGSPFGIPMRETIAGYGVSRGNFYCSSWHGYNNHSNWNATPGGGMGTYMSYSLFTNIDAKDGNINTSFNVPEKIQRSQTDWGLMADLIKIRSTNGEYLSVNHGKSGNKSEPSGSNILYVGGNVQWTLWENQSQVYAVRVNYGSGYYYYYSD